MPTDPSDTSDADIRMAYHSIAQQGALNWLLLSYGKWAGGLKLFAAGSRGVSELKRHVTNDNVYFAFCRETSAGFHYYVTIAYIPENVSGLRKTRAISTSRTVQTWFKISQATITVSSLDDLTPESVIQAVRTNPHLHHHPQSGSFNYSHLDLDGHHKSLPRPPAPEMSSQFSSVPRNGPHDTTLHPSHIRSLSDMGDAAERAKRRCEAQHYQQAADEFAAEEEALRQLRIKNEKAEVFKHYEQDETKRREALDRDLKRAATIRAGREEEERQEAEQRKAERELKRHNDAEKRIADSQRIEAWRKAEQLRLHELARREEESLRAIETAKQASQRAALQTRAEKLTGTNPTLLQGWVTIQNTNSLVWRRRWFILNATSMVLFRNDKDLNRALDTVELSGCIQGVKEWNESFEELKAIPHSFAITFNNSREPLLMYADTAGEKTNLAGFLLTY